MSKNRPAKKLKECLIISPIADELTPERANIFKRAKYLERQIAAALRPKPHGLKATLITSDKTKHWITPHMIRRLTSDPLAVAVLDDWNPNCMYEIGIRHAFCLPMICLIQKRVGGPSLPFNVRDIDPLEYPVLPLGGVWSKRDQVAFRRALQERAESVFANRPSVNFSDELDRVSAARLLRLIFAQRQLELDSLQKDLADYRHFLRKDYEITQKIANKAARRLFDLLAANNVRVTHRNDALRELARRPELLRLDREVNSYLSVCEKIAEIAEQLADVARRLKSSAVPKSASQTRPPTRGEIDGKLRTIIRNIATLNAEIVTLLNKA